MLGSVTTCRQNNPYITKGEQLSTLKWWQFTHLHAPGVFPSFKFIFPILIHPSTSIYLLLKEYTLTKENLENIENKYNHWHTSKRIWFLKIPFTCTLSASQGHFYCLRVKSSFGWGESLSPQTNGTESFDLVTAWALTAWLRIIYSIVFSKLTEISHSLCLFSLLPQPERPERKT